MNQAAIDKANRLYHMLAAHNNDKLAQKFMKLAMQAVDHNDFRICEMVYCWLEFECKRGS